MLNASSRYYLVYLSAELVEYSINPGQHSAEF
jgi:hypothetical protein